MFWRMDLPYSSNGMGKERTYCDRPIKKQVLPLPGPPKDEAQHPPNCSGLLLAQDNGKYPKFEP